MTLSPNVSANDAVVGPMAMADPDEDLSAVLPRLNPRRPVVTVWQDGRLVGMVSPGRLRERMSSAGL